MSEERSSPPASTKWTPGTPLWDSYVADLAARSNAPSLGVHSAENPGPSARCYFFPPWGCSTAPHLWSPGSVSAAAAAAGFAPSRLAPTTVGLAVPPAFPPGAPGLFPQDKMLNEFLTRPSAMHGRESVARPTSASALGDKLAAEALNALSFNLNGGCGDAAPTPTTSAPCSDDALPRDKAHMLRGILQGRNRLPEGMDLIAEPLMRDFAAKDNNNMVMKRPDLIGRLLASGKRGRRESAAPPVRDRRTIRRPRPDAAIIRTMQEEYELKKASFAMQAAAAAAAAVGSPLLVPVSRDLPPPPPLRPASTNSAVKENGDATIAHQRMLLQQLSEKVKDEHQICNEVDENSNGPLRLDDGSEDAAATSADDVDAEMHEDAVTSADSGTDGDCDKDTIDDGDDAHTASEEDAAQQPASPAGSSGSTADAKKARVENIVSIMRASPVLGQGSNPGAVNGCKKRKLYQPQQHSGDEDASVAAKVAKSSTDDGSDDTPDGSQDEAESLPAAAGCDDDDDDDDVICSDPRKDVGSPVHESRHTAPHSPEPVSAGLGGKTGMSNGLDLETLAETLKMELYANLVRIVDSIVSRYAGPAPSANRTGRLLGQTNNRGDDADRRSPRSKSDRPGMRFPAPASPVPVGPSSGGGAADGVLNLARMHQMQKFGGYLHGTAPLNLSAQPPAWHSPQSPRDAPEQKEALSLVVTPKKNKRAKISDTRPGARPLARYLGSGSDAEYSPKMEYMSDSPSPREPAPTPVGLPGAAGLHPDLLSSYSAAAAAFASYGNALAGRGPTGHLGHHNDLDSTPTLLHPAALLNAAHQAASPDLFGYGDAGSADSPVTELTYDGYRPTISFSLQSSRGEDSPKQMTPITCRDYNRKFALNSLLHSSTLTPMHLRKAKLMFFWVRYPSSAILKTYFPDINFNKNNTAQLVKWFSNFREFYYIQMEKYARQALAEGIESPEDIHVNPENCELLRILNLHYNRNNHIDMPASFSYVVEQTMREFFRAVKDGKDVEPSWKKAIYKIIARLDDSVPEYFKSQSFLEQLE